ncbi:hypothetical protein [Streptomyces caatingaensis]|uniref:Uncharacterized protein n=1 Tax=Streptomyces caatingaensis TaxID=1678637 RepID=A0A0K9XLC7_9ACTN|nr:hypothetical protein [Streptomyces caatingaensis]KNB54199.1 hypothetical protein AC230_02610 [Streptomyces caatingaensis]
MRASIQALQLLASDAVSQIGYARRLKVEIDEIAPEFDDAFRLARGLHAEGLIEADFAGAMSQIDETLRQMTGHPGNLWSEDGVRSSRE